MVCVDEYSSIQKFKKAKYIILILILIYNILNGLLGCFLYLITCTILNVLYSILDYE